MGIQHCWLGSPEHLGNDIDSTLPEVFRKETTRLTRHTLGQGHRVIDYFRDVGDELYSIDSERA